MRVLGIGGLDHNGSVAVLEGGVVVGFLECERVLREKNVGLAAPGALKRTVEALAPGPIAGIGIADLAFWRSEGATVRPTIQSLFGDVPTWIWPHHDCHGFAALLASPFESATCVTIDGKGDGLSASAFLSDRMGHRRQVISVPSASSLGRLWWGVSEFCGLPGHHSAGKIMALAAYGRPLDLWKDHIELLQGGGFRMHPLTQHSDTFRQVPRIVEWLESKTGRPAGALDEDVAASLQSLTERVVEHIVAGAVAQTGVADVCLAGGVGLNGLANQRLMRRGIVGDLFVPSVTDDRGLSLGAAALTSLRLGATLPNHPTALSPFLGPHAEPEEPCAPWVRFRTPDAEVETARQIAGGGIVAVCRGRDEAGPRALGHRSLLASPTVGGIRDWMNAKVKRRESFRPFGCSLPLDEASQWFDLDGASPYMLRIATARPDRASQIPGVLHKDGTSRIQTVTPHDGSGLWEILDGLRRLGQPPVVLNTSLNRRGEPLAHTVHEAASATHAMGVEHLLTDAGLFEVGV